MAESIEKLLKGNEAWVEETKKQDPGFFDKLAQGQSPEYLWIGCADSRMPASSITGTKPGEMFVQRNIANMVVHTDSNLMSVVFYAVKALKVKHIVVCGHYGCGGVMAAMSRKGIGYIDNWLVHIKDVYRLHREELNAIGDEDRRFDRLVELNVEEQVNNLSKISFLQEEWAGGGGPQIHGMVYSLKKGSIKDLGVSVKGPGQVAEEFRLKV